MIKVKKILLVSVRRSVSGWKKSESSNVFSPNPVSLIFTISGQIKKKFQVSHQRPHFKIAAAFTFFKFFEI